MCNKTNNLPSGSLNYDPLAKVYALLEMCQVNFRLRYTPSEYISLDETVMALKDRIWGFFCNSTYNSQTNSI